MFLGAINHAVLLLKLDTLLKMIIAPCLPYPVVWRATVDYSGYGLPILARNVNDLSWKSIVISPINQNRGIS